MNQQLAASQARCRELEREIETLTTCGCEGCDDNLEESAFCFPCMNKVQQQVTQLQATLAAREAEIVNLKTCQCEGCDMSLEGEAYCTRCVTKRVNELVSLLAACGATENIDGTLNFDATQFPVANRITEMQSDMRVLWTRVESLKAERDAAVQQLNELRGRLKDE